MTSGMLCRAAASNIEVGFGFGFRKFITLEDAEELYVENDAVQFVFSVGDPPGRWCLMRRPDG